MTSSQRLEINDESQVGEARRFVADRCRQLGHDETFCGQAAIVASEVARNVHLHGGGGELLFNEVPDGALPALELLALDQGPGIANVAECFRDGHSTTGTSGTGLGAIRRLASQVELQTAAGRGTALWVRLEAARSKLPEPDTGLRCGGVSVALLGEERCGDAWAWREAAGTFHVIVADGLGHGPFAEEASREALKVFALGRQRSVAETLEAAHLALIKTRGAAASIAEISPAKHAMVSAGVGNVSMRLHLGGAAKTLLPENGTLGASIRKIQPLTQPWGEDALLVIHTDGIGTQWNLDDYPGLRRRHPSLIAGVLYRDFRRKRDDATVVVVRQKN